MSQNKDNSAFFYVLAAVLCWSTVATAFKIALSAMNYAQLLFYSSFFSAMILLAISYAVDKQELKNSFNIRSIKENISLGFLNPFLYYMVLFKAYSLLPAQEAQPLNYTWPIVLSIFSAFFLKSKLTVRTFIGLLISFAGVVIIATRGDVFGFKFHNLFGTLLAIGSSVIWSAYWIMNMLDKRPDSIKLLHAFIWGTVLSGIFILFFDSFAISNWTYLTAAAYIGCFEMSAAFFLWLKGISLGKGDPKLSSLAYLSPFISLMFISLILGEKILLSSMAGLVLIVAGIIYQKSSKA
ncbi:MAG TPA: DMT family transporter [Ignavibacteriales bacterium]|nr:DMT family transporter [Ignavibacteriales bacterium]